MKVVARYRLKNANPFWPQGGQTARVTAEVADDVPLKRLEEFARARTPKGYEFIEVDMAD